MILDKVCSISKFTAKSTDPLQRDWQTISGAEGVKMNIQPAGGELTVLAEGQYAKTFRFFTTYSGLGVGMRVTVSGTSDVYDVRGVEDWNFPPLPHYEGVLIRVEE